VGSSDDNLPPELRPNHTTIEYLLPAQTAHPTFFFAIDTCITVSELQSLKESIMLALTQIPSDSYVGLMTFGTTVCLAHPPSALSH